MKKTLSLFLIMLMGTFFAATAQNSQFHVGLAFPQGNFGDDDASDYRSGYAATGLNIGYKHYSPLTTPNLSFIFGIDAFYNDVNSDQKDMYEKYYKGYDISLTKYINVPLNFGLSYSFPISEGVHLYGEGGIGANMAWGTPFRLEKSSYEYTMSFTPGFGFCYGLEGGVLIQNKYTIGLKYNQLGSYKLKYKVTEISDGDKETDKGKTDKQPISLLTLAVGLRF